MKCSSARGRSASGGRLGARAVLSRAIEALEPRLLLSAGQSTTAPALLVAAAVVQPQVTAGATLKVTATSPRNGAVKAGTATDVTVTFGADVNPLSINGATFELRDANNAVVPATVSYTGATRTATLHPTSPLATSNNYYYARVHGGTTGLTDTAGNWLAADFTWSFTTGTPVFTESIVYQNIDHATKLTFAPDGRVFIAEKSGIIKVYDNIDDKTPTQFLDLRTQVHNFWDRGLLGLAVPPNFAQNPYVYVLYAYDGDIGGTAPKWGVPGGTTDDGGPDPTGVGTPASARLSRFLVKPDGTAGPEQVLIHDWPQQYFTHSIGSVAFGPDGALYVSGGDSSNAFYTDYGQQGGNPFNDPVNEGGALRSQDLQTPSDPTTLDGTIIRIDPETGAALPSNPLYATGNDANAKRIFAYGLRNPYRITFRPGTNEMWIGDVGNTWAEEINRLYVPTTLDTNTGPVKNYGWPAYEGMEKQGGFDAANLPVIENLYNQGPGAVVFPYWVYHRGEAVIAGTNEATGGSSTTGLAFYGGPGGGTSYPAAYDGALFFTDYTRQRLWVMYLGPDGQPDPASRQLFASVSGPVDLEIGPNGDLFYVDYNNGTIRRYQYFTTNRPPRAAIATDHTNGPAPLTVQFNAAGSFDADPEDVLSYAWDLDGDGQFNDSTAAAPTYEYTTPGDRTVRVRVTDPQGASDVASVVISAGNSPPVPTILSPSVSLVWKVGDTISFSGSASDAQDGTLPASSLSWLLILHHDNLADPSSSHEHILRGYDGVAGGSFVAPDHEYPSRLELRLTATDSGGLSATTSYILQPQTATLNFTSMPAGLKIGFNSDAYTTPFSKTVILGSSNSISASSPQVLNGTMYTFARWSDGGGRNHNVIANAASADYTAVYTVPLGSGDVTSGLMYRYQLDEGQGSSATDAVSGNNGAITPVMAWGAGRVGAGALQLDGTGGYIGTHRDLAGVLGGTATLTAWVKTTQTGNDAFSDAPGIAGVDQSTGGGAPGIQSTGDAGIAWGWLDAAGHVAVQAGGGNPAKSTAVVNDGQWHLIALSRDAGSGQLKVYVDGALQATAAGATGLKSTAFNSIGRIDDAAGAPVYFAGTLDEVRVYDRVLTDAEVQAVKDATPSEAPPPPPSLWIDDVTRNEGNAGTTTFTFTVIRTGDTTGSSTVAYAAGGGDAVVPDDYASASGTLSFAPGETSKTVDVLVNGDTTVETDETFLVTLSSPVGAVLADGSGTGKIVNDDLPPPPPPPELSIDDVSKGEGNAGTTAFTFTVTRTGSTAAESTVGYSTLGAAATSADDFAPASGTLTFAAGETSKTITVLVNGDAVFEHDEAFYVDLAGPTNGTLTRGRGTGTIQNDDAAPSLSIDDVSKGEGNAGTTAFTFTVTRTGSTAVDSTVGYSTLGNSATAADDFATAGGTLTFGAGETIKTVTVQVSGDTTYEPDEAFFVDLSAATDAAIVRGRGTGTITNDDAAPPPPTLSIADMSKGEGNSGNTAFVFTVTRAGSTTGQSTVAYSTLNGTATSGSDFTAATGTLTFAAGETSKTITVQVTGDTTSEPDEVFLVALSNVAGATLARAQAVGAVINDDAAPPTLSIADLSKAEGNSGNTAFAFTVTRAGSTAAVTTVQYATSGGSTTDYTAASGTLTFAAGETTKTVTVQVKGDTTVESDENFLVTLSAPSGGATLTRAQATGFMLNDDAGAQVVTSLTLINADTDQPIAGFSPLFDGAVLNLAALPTPRLSIRANTNPGTVGSVRFAYDTSTSYRLENTLPYSIAGDNAGDYYAWTPTVGIHTVKVTPYTGANGAGTVGVPVTITFTVTNAAVPPTVSIAATDAGASETATDTGTFTVTRTGPTTSALTVNVALGGTALNGSDYQLVTTPVTIPAGSASKTVVITPIDDTAVEASETVILSLAAGTGYTVSTTGASATVTIADNDTSTPTQLPYTVPFAINATGTTTIEAENYDKGGEGVAYHDNDAANVTGAYRPAEGVDLEAVTDTGGGYNIGHVQAGEWTEYTVNVATTGRYDIGIRFASAYAGGQAHVELGGTNITGAIALNSTGGWQNWQTFWVRGVTLTAGQNQILRLSIDSSATAGQDVGNINWLSVQPAGPAPTPPAWPSTWQTAAAATTGARFEAAGTAFGGKIYEFGGFLDSSWHVARTYASYDPATNQWTNLGTLPVGMAETHLGLADDGQYMYFAGGFGGDLLSAQAPPQWISDAVWRYDPSNNSWLKIATMPQARGAGSLAILSRELHYFGGNPGDRVTNLGDHFVYNLDTGAWRTAAALPNAKDHLSSVVLNGKIYALGGEHGHDQLHEQQSDMHVYDPATDSWTKLANMPIAKSHMEGGTFVSDGKIIMAGGQVNDFQPTANVVAYDPTVDAWTTLISLPAARQGGIVRRIGNKIIVALGATQTNSPQATAWTGTLP